MTELITYLSGVVTGGFCTAWVLALITVARGGAK